MLDALGLIRRHQAKGVLVDTNLLVLYLVGSVNRRRVTDFKRTAAFSIEDFDLLGRLIAWFGKLMVTPHVLSQVSDLTKLQGKELAQLRSLFKELVETMEETFDESRILVTHPVFARLGLADAAIAKVCSRGILVLTTDVELYLSLQALGADAVNFNHVRALDWSSLNLRRLS
jgi:hypothetical protein